jgi:hypothetical protein
MGVKALVRHHLRGFTIFIICFAFVVIILYGSSYQNRQEVPVPTLATTTPATSTPAITTEKPAEKKTVVIKRITPWKSVMTTVFWVGETAGEDNDFITNTESYWDEHWQDSFGGVDSPNCRNGYHPCEFTPRENPFYFALPYAEYDQTGILKASAKTVPWYGKDSRPLLKNRWIVVKHGEAVCYAQWQDVGPNGEDDFKYVFGDSVTPVNTFGEKAGLDVSPALYKCLQMFDNAVTQWSFVDEADVPAGPWRSVVTTSLPSWGI